MTTELLFRDDAYLKTATARVIAVHERGIELDRTIFYPLGGGQMGDTGVLLRASGERVAIGDTRKGDAIDSVLHVPAATPQLEVGETLQLEVDWERRYALMRLHTALHVMSCVVVAPVTGGNISPDKGRLDFDIDMSLLDAEKIERATNELIARGIDTQTVWITDEELDARPELVKTMKRTTASWRRARTAAQDPGHRLAALRRHAREEYRRDRRDPRAQDPQRGQTQ
jgi:misacylated tRNA(Ala) deacylase